MSQKKPKKFRIVPPKRCKDCKNAADCEFLQQLQEAPFDASGIILDCKAFYTVFCELEKRCQIPFDDPDKMSINQEESENGERPFITPPMFTNGLFATELALKALTLQETGTFDCVHDLYELFESLPEPHQKNLINRIKERLNHNKSTIEHILKIHKSSYTKWRYFFSSESVGYSNSILELIHIICDYAIEKLDVDFC